MTGAEGAALPLPQGSTIGLQEVPAGAAVIVWQRTLVVFRSPLGFASVEARADAARSRVEQVLDDLGRQTIRSEHVELAGTRGLAVYAGPHRLFFIVEADLNQAGGETLETAGELVRERIIRLARDHAEQRSVTRLARGFLLTAVATVAFGVFWLAVLRVRTVLLRRIIAGSRHGRARLQVFGFDARPLLLGLARFSARTAVLVAVLGGAFLWLTYSLSLFPYTRPWSERLGHLLVDAVSGLAIGAVHELPNLLAVLVIYLVTRGVVRVLSAWFAAIETGRSITTWLDPEAARATRRLFSIGIWLFALTVAYPYLPGSESDAFKGVSVFVGLMVSLGGANFVSQLIGGLAVVYSRSIRTGDFIAVGDVQGLVRNLGVLSTKVVTRSGEEVTLPNALLVSSAIRNHSRLAASGSSFSTTVTIGYDVSWRQVESMLVLAAARTAGVLRTPEPRVFQTALEDFYVRYELVGFLERADTRPEVLDRLHGCIQDVFNENGVQIMSPHFVAQPAGTVVVPKERWQVPPTSGGPST